MQKLLIAKTKLAKGPGHHRPSPWKSSNRGHKQVALRSLRSSPASWENLRTQEFTVAL